MANQRSKWATPCPWMSLSIRVLPATRRQRRNVSRCHGHGILPLRSHVFFQQLTCSHKPCGCDSNVRIPKGQEGAQDPRPCPRASNCCVSLRRGESGVMLGSKHIYIANSLTFRAFFAFCFHSRFFLSPFRVPSPLPDPRARSRASRKPKSTDDLRRRGWTWSTSSASTMGP